MNYEYIKEEINKLKSEITRLESEIAVLPPGKIYCTKSKNYIRWYQSDGHTSKYIPKLNKQLIRELIQKKYYILQKDYFQNELRILQSLLSKHFKNTDHSTLLLADFIYQPFLIPTPHNKSYISCTWAKEDYEKSNLYPEQLEHPCKSGHIVRSKSEYMIDTALFEAGLVFRYECKLVLGDIILYPDFMIMHPVTKEIFIWEHFGLINRQSYASQAFDKLKIYSENNYYPNINLITTYETPKHPLTYAEIEQTIHRFFISRN
ncbi:MAG: hypothetical protein ACI4EX_03095 [Lachnospiraceae bacterium]